MSEKTPSFDESLKKMMICMELLRKQALCSENKELPQSEYVVMNMIGFCAHRHNENLEDAFTEEEPVYVSHLVKKMQVPPPMVSRSLKGLEEKGYLIRETDKKDRRNTLVFLTEKGRASTKQTADRLIAFRKAVEQRMDREDLEQLSAMIGKLAAAMEDAFEAEASANAEP